MNCCFEEEVNGPVVNYKMKNLAALRCEAVLFVSTPLAPADSDVDTVHIHQARWYDSGDQERVVVAVQATALEFMLCQCLADVCPARALFTPSARWPQSKFQCWFRRHWSCDGPNVGSLTAPMLILQQQHSGVELRGAKKAKTTQWSPWDLTMRAIESKPRRGFLHLLSVFLSSTSISSNGFVSSVLFPLRRVNFVCSTVRTEQEPFNGSSRSNKTEENNSSHRSNFADSVDGNVRWLWDGVTRSTKLQIKRILLSDSGQSRPVTWCNGQRQTKVTVRGCDSV